MSGGAAAPGAVWVTADLGNSSLDLALWVGDAIAARGRFERDDAAFGREAFARWYTGLGEQLPELREARADVWLSSVAGQDGTRSVAELLGQALGCDVGLHPDPGLHNRTETPETVGLDRLYAGRGALELAPEGAVVLDVGSALTVDAVRTGPDGPEFLGGAIAPGPRLLARALGDGGAQLYEVDPRPPVPALGRHTRAALESGVVHGLRGAAAELARRVGMEAGLAGAPRIVTGGAALWLLEPDPFWSGAVRHAPDLVQRGLLLAARDGGAERA